MEPTQYAMVQRAAVFSWEAMTTLLATAQETNVINVIFPRPVIILSAYPSIAVQGGSPNLPMPTLDDILVRIEVDTGFERRLTTRWDAVQANGVGALPSVTLGSYRDTTGGARVMNYELGTEGRPELQVTFSWKRPILVGSPWFQDIFPSLVFHCNFKDKQ
jgi:hypothetical protein